MTEKTGKTTSRQAYLGDGCYAAFDGYSVELTTSNGIETTNRIVLEPEVFDALAKFVACAREDVK